MIPSFDCRPMAKMDAFMMSLLSGVFLSEIVLTNGQNEFQIYISLRNFREPRFSSRLIGTRSAIECCVACEMNTKCEAANFHTGDGLCELITPGTTLMSPGASTGWAFYYTDTKYLHPFFNAYASQESTRHNGVAGRAIDGNKGFRLRFNTCTHTGSNTPWWMVDLYLNFHVETVIIWNRIDCCYYRLRTLTITVSPTLSGLDDPDSVCTTYLGPPSSRYDNPVVLNCNRIMMGRYVKISMHTDGILSLCEVELA